MKRHTRRVMLHADQLVNGRAWCALCGIFLPSRHFAVGHSLSEQRELIRVGRELLRQLEQVAKVTGTRVNVLEQMSDDAGGGA